jgi:hypothetical protein
LNDVTSALNCSERLGSVTFVPPVVGWLPEVSEPPDPEEPEPLLPDEPEPPDPEDPPEVGGELDPLEVPLLGPVPEEEPDACWPAPPLVPFDALVVAGEDDDVPDEQALAVSANSATAPASHKRRRKFVIETGRPRVGVRQPFRSSWARERPKRGHLVSRRSAPAPCGLSLPRGRGGRPC